MMIIAILTNKERKIMRERRDIIGKNMNEHLNKHVKHVRKQGSTVGWTVMQ